MALVVWGIALIRIMTILKALITKSMAIKRIKMIEIAKVTIGTTHATIR